MKDGDRALNLVARELVARETEPIGDPIAAIRAQLVALENRARPLAKTTSRDEDRRKVHAAFVAVTDWLELQGWSRARIAHVLGVDPVTLKDWIETGDRQRNQLPGWLFAAMGRLPAEAFDLFLREAFGWRAAAERSGTDG